MVGRIIGKGGETIKDLQKRFNASIQIDQSAMPCKVTITGPSHTIASARRAIEDLIRSTGPPPGGMGMGGGRCRAACCDGHGHDHGCVVPVRRQQLDGLSPVSTSF